MLHEIINEVRRWLLFCMYLCTIPICLMLVFWDYYQIKFLHTILKFGCNSQVYLCVFCYFEEQHMINEQMINFDSDQWPFLIFRHHESRLNFRSKHMLVPICLRLSPWFCCRSVSSNQMERYWKLSLVLNASLSMIWSSFLFVSKCLICPSRESFWRWNETVSSDVVHFQRHSD